MWAEFKRKKTGRVDISFKDMTSGEALALANALRNHAATPSPVCRDLQIALHHAIERAPVSIEHRDLDQELFEATKEKTIFMVGQRVWVDSLDLGGKPVTYPATILRVQDADHWGYGVKFDEGVSATLNDGTIVSETECAPDQIRTIS